MTKSSALFSTTPNLKKDIILSMTIGITIANPLKNPVREIVRSKHHLTYHLLDSKSISCNRLTQLEKAKMIEQAKSFAIATMFFLANCLPFNGKGKPTERADHHLRHWRICSRNRQGNSTKGRLWIRDNRTYSGEKGE